MPPSLASPQPKPREQLGEAPFDDTRADLILQSSDNVQFRVFKAIFYLASPIFADMFSIPSSPSEKPHDDAQVVPLSEHSTALDIALRHIYPVRRTPKADTLHYASILAEFSRKYQVEALHQFIIGYLMDGIEHDPVGVYAIAVTYGYDDIGAKAARSCLNLPFSNLQSPYLRYATAEHILELVKYHVACGQAASALASSDRSWFLLLAQNGTSHRNSGCSTAACRMPDFTSQTGHRRTTNTENVLRPLCVWNYFHRSALVLAQHPTPEAITAEEFVLKTNDCPTCAPYMRAYMLELSMVFGREIKKAISQVNQLYRDCCPCQCSYMAGSLTQGCLRGIG
jgi:BTB/POZ domain-containing protein